MQEIWLNEYFFNKNEMAKSQHTNWLTSTIKSNRYVNLSAAFFLPLPLPLPLVDRFLLFSWIRPTLLSVPNSKHKHNTYVLRINETRQNNYLLASCFKQRTAKGWYDLNIVSHNVQTCVIICLCRLIYRVMHVLMCVALTPRCFSFILTRLIKITLK